VIDDMLWNKAPLVDNCQQLDCKEVYADEQIHFLILIQGNAVRLNDQIHSEFTLDWDEFSNNSQLKGDNTT
jgi:hypothetical protein